MELNDLQHAAVYSEAKNIVCIAAPGSGKTRTLAERITRLIREGCPPSSIVAITFTNAAADEIIKRVAMVSGLQSLRLGYAGTMHGFILRMLKDYGGSIGLCGDLSVVTPEERQSIINEIVEAHQYNGSQEELAVEIKRNPLIDTTTGVISKAAKAAVDYHRHLLENGLVDFDSIIGYGVAWLRTNTDPLIFSHLLVDEVQDLSDQHMEICKRLPIRNKFYVGDPRQAIYGFNGGNVQNIYTLMSEAQQVFQLTLNYRSAEGICRYANNLISWSEQLGHSSIIPMIAANPHLQHAVRLTTAFKNEGEEMTEVAERLNFMQNIDEVAILLRTRSLVKKWRDHLLSKGFPVKARAFREQPADWPAARQFISLMANPHNNVLAYWWLHRKLGRKPAQYWRLQALSRQCSIYEAGVNQKNKDYIPELSFSNLLSGMANQGFSDDSLHMVEKAMKRLNESSSMLDLIYDLGQDKELHDPEEGNGLTVCTIHAAKGREWDAVFCPSWAQTVIPSGKNPDIEEERRVAFVAITRARQILWVSCPQQMTLPYRDQPESVVTSQYIEEMKTPRIS